ncbi:MAG: peptide-methionine (S)-S-oxide reductase MsrA [Halieaceae bacterium]|jgi:peptide-methionine (S)-S-oxide reductase|nr:peptide-methionine (S)-S-oxide reductase MsrA [Halieaceae bacterium]
MTLFRSLLCTALLCLSGMAWSASAVFAGGCFWCMEAAYQGVPGVTDVVSGFSGGTHPNPTYSGAHDGHYEVVEVTYDPQQISFADLLDIYWVNVDPFDGDGQFCDRGESYRPAIFVETATERELAQVSLNTVQAMFPGRKIEAPILERAQFFPVEEYHQDYYLKNPVRYRYYRWGCGRDRRLDEVWEGSEIRARAEAVAPAAKH